MKALALSAINENIKNYLQQGIKNLYKIITTQTNDKKVQLLEQISLPDDYYNIDGLIQHEKGEFYFIQKNEDGGEEEDQFVAHLGIDEMIAIMGQLEKISGKTFDLPCTLCHTDCTNPKQYIDILQTIVDHNDNGGTTFQYQKLISEVKLLLAQA